MDEKMNHNLLRDEIKDAEIVCHAEKKQYAEALKGIDESLSFVISPPNDLHCRAKRPLHRSAFYDF